MRNGSVQSPGPKEDSMMTTDLFVQLLDQPEGETLDFKRDQYKFVGMKDDNVRSELLKDVLAFANTPRVGEAFIIVGVKKHPGGRSDLVGIQPQTRAEDHLDDAQVQQFVNQKANADVKFLYQEFDHAGKTFGVFRIPVTDIDGDGFRYVENDYGKVKKYHVYARQGSSTVVLTPDQLYRMGQASVVQPVPSFRIELVDPGSGDAIGTRVEFETTYMVLPDQIPDVRPYVPTVKFGGSEFAIGMADFGCNTDCMREIGEYVHYANAFRSFQVRITNTGSVHATGVRLELTTADSEVRVWEDDEVPDMPRTRRDIHIPKMSGIRRRGPDELTVAHERETLYRVTSGELDIQPGRSITLTPATHISSRSSRTVRVEGHLYGDALRKPVPVVFEFEFRVTEQTLTVDRLRELYRNLCKLEKGEPIDE
jgi:hypothetical protein